MQILFYIKGIVNMPATQLIDCLHENVEEIPSWNDDVALVKRIQVCCYLFLENFREKIFPRKIVEHF